MLATGRVFGSSPRGRGTHRLLLRRSQPLRFIPAWAGNTIPVSTRDCGCCGSSPRGRGTLARPGPRSSPRRFIPAWAGNTCSHLSPTVTKSVHPRVGGEHSSDCARRTHSNGSSPRGRGTRPKPKPQPSASRFIPAWAGNTNCPHSKCFDSSVHPRVGGEHRSGPRESAEPTGSSPRGRGTRRGPGRPAGR